MEPFTTGNDGEKEATESSQKGQDQHIIWFRSA